MFKRIQCIGITGFILMLMIVHPLNAQPTLLTPANGATNLSTVTINFSWTSSTPSYLLQVSTTNVFDPGDIVASTITGFTNQTVGPFAEGVTLYWRVIDGNGLGASSSVFSFSTEVLPPTAPVLYLPGDTDIDISHNPTFVWYSSDGAGPITYTLQYGTTSGVYTDSVDNLTDTVLVSSLGLSATTQYYWRVVAINPGNRTNSTEFSFTTAANGPPYQIINVSPANFTNPVPLKPTLVWMPNPLGSTPVTYRLQVTTDPSLTTFLFDTLISHPINSYTFWYDLDLGTKYYWRVQGQNGFGNGPFSSAWNFTTTIAVKPILSWPVDGNTVYTSTPLGSWYLNSQSTGLTFEGEYTTDITFTTFATFTSGTLSASFTSLMGGQMYYWRVRSIEGPVTSDWSDIDSFYVHPSVGGLLEAIPSWPIGGNTHYSNPPTLLWYHDYYTPPQTYHIIIATDNIFTSIVDTATVDIIRNYTTPPLQRGIMYYWKILSSNDGGVTFPVESITESFIIEGSATGPVTPTLNYPGDGDTIYTALPTLYWYLDAHNYGFAYHFELSDDPSFLTTVADTITSAFSYQVYTPLNHFTTYYWRVRSDDGISLSPWSSVYEFYVDNSLNMPVKPILGWPIGGNDVWANSVQLSWYFNSQSPSGLLFEGEVATDPGFGAPIATFSGVTNFYYNLTGLTSNMMYYWRVRSTDGVNFSAYSDIDSFFTVLGSGSPVPPIPGWPIGGTTVYTNDPELSWYLDSPNPGFEFEVQYSVYPNFLFSSTAIPSPATDMSVELTGLTSGTTYYWRVRSKLGLLYSAYSPTESFTTAANNAPIVPLPGSPKAGSIIATSSPMLSWVIPTASTNQTYELEVSTTPNFSNAVKFSNINKQSYRVNNLVNGVQYFWRVRSVKDGVNSEYSVNGSFVASGITSLEEDLNSLPKGFEVAQNYPNPFNPTTNIRFSIAEQGFVSITIYNMLGQEVKTLINSDFNQGTYTVQWNGDDNFGRRVSSGTYIYRVISGNFVETKKMVLIK